MASRSQREMPSCMSCRARAIAARSPPGVEPEKAEAVYRNGVLEVRIPKVPGPGPRRIEVKT